MTVDVSWVGTASRSDLRKATAQCDALLQIHFAEARKNNLTLDSTLTIKEAIAARQPGKANYVGAPAIFALEGACQQINRAFHGKSGSGHCYLVGSALTSPDWRDIDVRYIMPDDEFQVLFPDSTLTNYEFDTRWLLLTVSISNHLKTVTGLPVDFQIQPASVANGRHTGNRHALGMMFASAMSVDDDDEDT